jgi:hypothetical protein
MQAVTKHTATAGTHTYIKGGTREEGTQDRLRRHDGTVDHHRHVQTTPS